VLACAGCASSAANLQPSKVPAGHGALFGHIAVENQGKDVTSHCYVGLTNSANEQHTYLSLDQSGWLFSSVPRGQTYVSNFLCTLGGLIKYNAAFHTRRLSLNVPGNGAIAYFGHVRIDLNSGGSGAVAGTLLGGGIGAALTTSREGDQATLELRDGFDEAKREYVHRYGQQAVLTPSSALAMPPTTGPVLAESPGSP